MRQTALIFTMSTILTAAPASAQPNQLTDAQGAELQERLNDDVIAKLARAEQARQASNCRWRYEQLNQTAEAINAWTRMVSPVIAADWNRRLAEARALPCPPTASPPPQPEPPSPSPPDAGTRTRGQTRVRGEPLPRTRANQERPAEGMTRTRGQTRTRGEPLPRTRANPERPDEGMTRTRGQTRTRGEPLPRTRANPDPRDLAVERLTALRRAFRECGNGLYIEAREDLIDALAEEIRLENDPERARVLEQERDAVIASSPERCVQSGLPSTFTFAWLMETARPPLTGIGVRRDGPPGQAPEIDAGRTPGKVELTGAEVELQGQVGRALLRLRISYAEGDARTSFSVPASSGSSSSGPRVDAGTVYGGLSRAGNSGIIGPLGLTGETRVHMSRFRIGGEIGVNVSPGSRLFVTLDYFREVRRYEMSASASGGSGSSTFEFEQTRSQNVRDNFFMLGAGGQVHVPLGSVFSAEFGVSGGAMLRDTALESTERNTNNFSVAADRDFTLEFRDDLQEIEFWARAKARAEARLSRNVSLFVGGSAEYVSGFGTVFNPGTGDQVFFDGLTTALGEPRGRWSWNATGGITVRFGRRR